MSRQKIRRVVFETEEIAARVRQLGREITEHYAGSEDLLVLGVLKGSFIFLADLVRTIRLPLKLDFLVASSYGDDRTSSGNVRLLYEPEVRIQGRHVILVEDIVDGGRTVDRVISVLQEREPLSLEVCTLLHKRLVTPRKEPRWVGFEAPREFLVGYGLDYAEDLRHLPFIGSL